MLALKDRFTSQSISKPCMQVFELLSYMQHTNVSKSPIRNAFGPLLSKRELVSSLPYFPFLRVEEPLTCPKVIALSISLVTMSSNTKQYAVGEPKHLVPTPGSISSSQQLNMSSSIDHRNAKVDGFPFPYQPTPPISKQVSLASTHPIHANDSPIIANVGEPRSTSIIRGGFGVTKATYDHDASSPFKVYPPLSNAAYHLTSQAHASKDAANINFRVYTPTSTEDQAEADGEHGVIVDRSRNPDVTSSRGTNNLDGAAQDTDEANSIATAITASAQTKDQRSINDMVYIPPRRQPLILHTRHVAEPLLGAASRNTKTRGELLADNIDFTEGPHAMDGPPGVSGPFYPPEEQRADFIEQIDKFNPELEYCKKCKTKHIPPGPPTTLQDRDTCGVYLPEWFPAGNFEKPWAVFTKIMNDLVTMDEINNGYSHKPNPDQPFWDLQFHEYSSRWATLGKRGGWWKCREGEDATEAELNCDVCHTKVAQEQRAHHVSAQ